MIRPRELEFNKKVVYTIPQKKEKEGVDKIIEFVEKSRREFLKGYYTSNSKH